MKELVSIQDVIKGNLKTGIYRCIDIEGEYTLNIGYGEVEIIHIAQGLLKNGKSCQFANSNGKLFFRVLQSNLVNFMTICQSVRNNANEIIIAHLPVFIKELILDDISRISITQNEILIMRKDNYKEKLLNPFMKHKDVNKLYKSPFANNKISMVRENKSQEKSQNIEHSNNNVNKIVNNNKNTIFNKKEFKNGLLR